MILLPVNIPVAIFGSTLVAFDVVFSRDALGEPAAAQEANRNIFGPIQPAGDKLIDLLPEGAQSSGAMIVHTAGVLTAADLSNNVDSGRQSFIRHAGEIWKVWGLQSWAPCAGPIQRYLLTKYVNINGNIT